MAVCSDHVEDGVPTVIAYGRDGVGAKGGDIMGDIVEFAVSAGEQQFLVVLFAWDFE